MATTGPRVVSLTGKIQCVTVTVTDADGAVRSWPKSSGFA